MSLPGHLEPDEAIRMGEAMLMTLYGLDLYKRWSDLKVFMGFTLESQFVQWIMEHMEGCQHKKCNHDVNAHQTTVNTGSDNEEEETVAVGMENFEEINGIESVDDGDDQVRTDTDRKDVKTGIDGDTILYSNEFYHKKVAGGTYQCNKCPYTNMKRTHMEDHYRTHHLAQSSHLRQVKCVQCDRRFFTNKIMQEHMRRFHNKRHHCNLCTYKTGRKTYLVRHLKSAHETSKEEVTSGENLGADHDYTNDVSTMSTADARHQCPHCDYSALLPTRVKLHCKKVHEIELADDFGDEAGNSIQKPQNNSAAVACRRPRKRLEQVKTNAVKQHKCPYCNYRADKASRIKLHCARVHEQRDDSDRVHQCVYCGKGYFSAQDLKEHTQIVHERTKKFTCNLCAFTSYHRGSIARHKQYIHKLAS